MAYNFQDKTISEKYHWAKQEELLLLKPIFELIGNAKNKTILDIGCGSGWLTKLISEKSKKVIGIDNSEELIKIAKSENSNNNIIYKIIDAKDLDKIDNDFEIIFSALTLQLITPKDKLLEVFKKAHKKLKDNGNFIILIPHPCFINQNNREYNKYIFEREFNYFDDPQEYLVKLKSQKGEIEFKANFYNLETYSRLFNEARFTVKNIVEPKVSEELKRKHPELWSLELTKPFYIIFNLIKQ